MERNNMLNRVYLFGCFLLLFVGQVLGQATVVWNKTLGGSGYEELRKIEETPDGNFVFFGAHTSMISGDISQDAFGLSDYWLVKCDQEDGSIIWQNRYGGGMIDNATSMTATADGGYLLFGYSSSLSSAISPGTKTESSYGEVWNSFDFWLVKTDADGNQLWDKTIQATSDNDFGTYVMELSNGTILVGGKANGDAGLDKSEDSIGDNDFWIINLDGDGNILWDRTIGGTEGDDFVAAVESPNGHIILGGTSYSGIGGDRTEDKRGEGADFWLVGMDYSGNVLWDKAIGGNDHDQLRSLIVTQDEQLLLLGYSMSDVSGDKTTTHLGERDIWMVKTDLSGNVLWDKRFAGESKDDPYQVVQSVNGNFLIASLSNSSIGGELSEDNIGVSDYWFITTDEDGNKLTDEIFGGVNNDNLYTLGAMSNGDIILGGITASDLSEDKTEPSRGNNDAWLIKYQSNMDIRLRSDTTHCGEQVYTYTTNFPDCEDCITTWHDGSTDYNRTFLFSSDSTIYVTVKDNYNGWQTDTFTIVFSESLNVDLGEDLFLCEGDSVLLDAGNIDQEHLWSTGAISSSIWAKEEGLYSIVVTDGAGCTFSDELFLNIQTPVSILEDISICEGDSIRIVDEWHKVTGIYEDTLLDVRGCDSLYLTTNLLVGDNYTIYLEEKVCDPILSGVETIAFTTVSGCDSIVIVDRVYQAPVLDLVSELTCDISESGIRVDTLRNEYGCDSVITETTIAYAGSPVESISMIVCAPLEAGEDTTIYTNQYGCDSTIIISKAYEAPAFSMINAVTCDPSAAGSSLDTIRNLDGCDSLIIETVTEYFSSILVEVEEQVCDLSLVGADTLALVSQYGCDSTVIITNWYEPPSYATADEVTCNPLGGGVRLDTLKNEANCDSLIIQITTNYVDEIVEYVEEVVCDASLVGIDTIIFSSQYGCDSLVIHHKTYESAIYLIQDSITCDSALADTTIEITTNQYGCDSLILETRISYEEVITEYIREVVCDTTLAEIDTLVGINAQGCTNFLITERVYQAPTYIRNSSTDCSRFTSDTVTTIISNQYGCDSLIVEDYIIGTGSAPVYLEIETCDSSEASIDSLMYTNINGCDSLVIVENVLLANTPPTYITRVSFNASEVGIDTLFLENSVGCDSLIITEIIMGDFTIDTTITDISCHNEEDGIFEINSVTGGAPPYQFAIDEGEFTTRTWFGHLSGGEHVLRILDNEGNIVEKVFTIDNPNPIIVDIGMDTIINIGSPLALEIITTSPFEYLYWNDTLVNCDSINCERFEVTPLKNTIYSVLIEDSNGCTGEDEIRVRVSREYPVFFPSAFSPNNDGVNDYFTIYPGYNMKRIVAMSIYNRWGGEVYRIQNVGVSDYSLGWDGKLNGVLMDSGVYIYVAELEFIDGSIISKVGDVTLFR